MDKKMRALLYGDAKQKGAENEQDIFLIKRDLKKTQKKHRDASKAVPDTAETADSATTQSVSVRTHPVESNVPGSAAAMHDYDQKSAQCFAHDSEADGNPGFRRQARSLFKNNVLAVQRAAQNAQKKSPPTEERISFLTKRIPVSLRTSGIALGAVIVLFAFLYLKMDHQNGLMYIIGLPAGFIGLSVAIAHFKDYLSAKRELSSLLRRK